MGIINRRKMKASIILLCIVACIACAQGDKNVKIAELRQSLMGESRDLQKKRKKSKKKPRKKAKCNAKCKKKKFTKKCKKDGKTAKDCENEYDDREEYIKNCKEDGKSAKKCAKEYKDKKK